MEEARLKPKAVGLDVEVGFPGGDRTTKPGLPHGGLGGGRSDDDRGVIGEVGRWCGQFNGWVAARIAHEEGNGLGSGVIEEGAQGLEG